MTKKILVNLPQPMLERANWIAAQQNRTRSDLVREALRLIEKKYREENPGTEIGTLPEPVRPCEMVV
ncbi:MAG TPA: hypothetical protein V6D22_17070 [Candidatus Obscuribacterales bacterium]